MSAQKEVKAAWRAEAVSRSAPEAIHVNLAFESRFLEPGMTFRSKVVLNEALFKVDSIDVSDESVGLYLIALDVNGTPAMTNGLPMPLDLFRKICAAIPFPVMRSGNTISMEVGNLSPTERTLFFSCVVSGRAVR